LVMEKGVGFLQHKLSLFCTQGEKIVIMLLGCHRNLYWSLQRLMGQKAATLEPDDNVGCPFGHFSPQIMMKPPQDEVSYASDGGEGR
jgi:hypothetical protein